MLHFLSDRGREGGTGSRYSSHLAAQTATAALHVKYMYIWTWVFNSYFCLHHCELYFKFKEKYWYQFTKIDKYINCQLRNKINFWGVSNKHSKKTNPCWLFYDLWEFKCLAVSRSCMSPLQTATLRGTGGCSAVCRSKGRTGAVRQVWWELTAPEDCDFLTIAIKN